MAKATLQDRYKTALETRGSVVVKTATRCITLSRPTVAGTFYFLGNAGSVRVGRNRQMSIPVSETFKAALLEDKAPLNSMKGNQMSDQSKSINKVLGEAIKA